MTIQRCRYFLMRTDFLFTQDFHSECLMIFHARAYLKDLYQHFDWPIEQDIRFDIISL